MTDGLEHAFFYPSDNHDRVYKTNSMEYWLKKFFTSGVFAGDLQVIANDNMSVSLTKGYVNIGGKVRVYQDDQELLLETAHATYDRIDSIVLERNDSDRDIFVRVITGGYSSNPVPLDPVRENGVDQRVVAQIRVTHGAVRITQADITDTRADPYLCGIVAGTVKEMDFSQFQMQFDSYFQTYKEEILAQYELYQQNISALEETARAEFDAWFDAVRDILIKTENGQLLEDVKQLYEDNYMSEIEPLKNLIGTSDISAVGDGTVTGAIMTQKGAIDALNTDMSETNSRIKNKVMYNIIDFFNDSPIGLSYFITTASLLESDRPDANYRWSSGTGILLKRAAVEGNMILFEYGTGRYAVGCIANGAFTGWTIK